MEIVMPLNFIRHTYTDTLKVLNWLSYSAIATTVQPKQAVG